MTEEAEVGVDPSPTSEPEQQAPHFLQDVIFHGKFKVSLPTRDKQTTKDSETVQTVHRYLML